MTVTTPVHQIQLQPGSIAEIAEISWQEFEEILDELGEKRTSRIAYRHGRLEIMVPQPEHERVKIIIADLVKTILRSQRRNWESLGSTTLKREDKAGVEPDDCFYIQNYQAVIGKDRINLEIDPPPDLAIESDITSKTRINAYVAVRVPEVWIYDAGLKIYRLQNDRYVEAESSLIFPELPISTIVSTAIERAKQIGISQALLELEHWLNANL